MKEAIRITFHIGLLVDNMMKAIRNTFHIGLFIDNMKDGN